MSTVRVLEQMESGRNVSPQWSPDGTELVYVGDGYSDRCAAESADLVFARRGLASYLEERGVPFERFEDFHSIARRLAS